MLLIAVCVEGIVDQKAGLALDGKIGIHKLHVKVQLDVPLDEQEVW